MTTKNIYWIDLFCGAGGTSSGIHLAGEHVKVLACVNHDRNAIKSHEENHPDAIHFVEDIRDKRLVAKLGLLVAELRRREPKCVVNLWASLECTNFSRAKGGLSKDVDSRTLADHMPLYLKAIDPDYFFVENVREFLDWGPVRVKCLSQCETYSHLTTDKKGNMVLVPDTNRLKEFYNGWKQEIMDYGYSYAHELLNSADYGSYQARTRLFIQFAKTGKPMAWPVKSHSKKAAENTKPWKAVKEILNLEEEGKSIFNRRKGLSDNTLKRIYAGLEKFVANGESVFIKKYFSGRPEGKVISVNGPSGTVKCIDNHAIVSSVFLSPYYGNSTAQSIENPIGTVTTKDRYATVNCHFIDQQYGTSLPLSINSAINTLTTVPKFNLATVEQRGLGTDSSTLLTTKIGLKFNYFLLNPQYTSKGSSIDQPCFTLIARMDKSPPYLIEAEPGKPTLVVYEADSETMKRIKRFMSEYGVVDIKMRMLQLEELLQIQGFPKDYKLFGTQAEQKKYIGNAVEVNMARALVSANAAVISKRKTVVRRHGRVDRSGLEISPLRVY